jgi:hypothetical protein
MLRREAAGRQRDASTGAFAKALPRQFRRSHQNNAANAKTIASVRSSWNNGLRMEGGVASSASGLPTRDGSGEGTSGGHDGDAG